MRKEIRRLGMGKDYLAIRKHFNNLRKYCAFSHVSQLLKGIETYYNRDDLRHPIEEEKKPIVNQSECMTLSNKELERLLL